MAYGTFTLHFTKQELGQRDGILLPASTQDCSITFSGPATTVQFSSAAYSVRENVGTATISVTLNAPSSQIVTVKYATSNGTATAGYDYLASCGTLTFSPGQTVRTFAVRILTDTVYEPDETVILTLSNPVNATLGAPNPATLIIQADVLHHITLSPKTASITAGQTQAYTVKGFDAAGNSLGDLTAKALFAISSGAGGSWTGNIYTSEKVGTWTVTASIGAVSDTATLTVKPAGPYTLSLQAYPTSLPVGSTSVLTATVRDRFANLVSNGTVVTFTTDLGKVLSPRTTTNGVATSQISSTVAGAAHITAKSGPAQGTATVVFTPIIPTCVTIQRGTMGQVTDTYIWSSRPSENLALNSTRVVMDAARHGR